MPSIRKIRGFTLIELCVVIMIGGFFTAAAAEGYRVYMQQKKLDDVNRKVAVVRESVKAFRDLETQRRYPCPANPALPVTDEQAGREVGCAALAALAPGTCTGEKGPGTGICRVLGRLHKPGEPEQRQLHVLIGAVPFKTLKEAQDTMMNGATVVAATKRDPNDPANTYFENRSSFSREDAISREDAVDPWGWQMVYAVTEELTDKSNYTNVDFGALRVETENGVTLVSPPGGAYFIALSPGENGVGAYNAEGVKQRCPAAADTDFTRDAENCDKGGTAAAVGAWDNLFIGGLRNFSVGGAYFDDTLRFYSDSMTELWSSVRDPATGLSLPDIYNTSQSNVGIGTDWRGPGNIYPPVPIDALEVRTASSKVGIRLQDGFLKVGTGLCGTADAGERCIPPALLGRNGTGTVCAQDWNAPNTVRVMRGITRNNADDSVVPCIEINSVPAITPDPAKRECTGGRLMTGIDMLGNITCDCPPNVVCTP